MDWLLMHSEDADADAPLTAEQKRQLLAVYGPGKPCREEEVKSSDMLSLAPVIEPRVQQAIAANVCTYAVTGPHYAAQVFQSGCGITLALTYILVVNAELVSVFNVQPLRQ